MSMACGSPHACMHVQLQLDRGRIMQHTNLSNNVSSAKKKLGLSTPYCTRSYLEYLELLTSPCVKVI
jgi:hypothetical protein